MQLEVIAMEPRHLIAALLLLCAPAIALADKPHHAGGKGDDLPPGLQKKLDRGGSLPPGWAKKLHRGDRLPDEVWVHREPLPPRIITQLPPNDFGTITVYIDGKVVRLLEATRTIIDVLDL